MAKTLRIRLDIRKIIGFQIFVQSALPSVQLFCKKVNFFLQENGVFSLVGGFHFFQTTKNRLIIPNFLREELIVIINETYFELLDIFDDNFHPVQKNN